MIKGTLFTSTRSPFGRKVLIGLIEANLQGSVEIRNVVTTPTAPAPELLEFNPLGTIPLLVTCCGEALIDSAAILDAIHVARPAAGLLPDNAGARRETLRRHALANGALDKAVRALGERFRTSTADTEQHEKANLAAIGRTLDLLDREVWAWPSGRFDVGDIALACLLGYLDFRFEAALWRKRHPLLMAWFAQVCHRKSVRQTIPAL